MPPSMSREAVSEIVARAREDADFKDALLSDPVAALGPYARRLTAEETRVLSSAATDPFALAVLASGPAVAEPWWRALVPASFKEVGGTILSVVLVIAFVLVLTLVLTRIGSDPRAVSVGGSAERVDEFVRAKDVFAIVIPLFGAVVTFWLGVAIEGRRADDHKENAAQAGKERDEAKDSERRRTTVAATALAECGQAVKRLRSRSEDLGMRGLPGGESDLEEDLNELDALLEQARRRVEG